MADEIVKDSKNVDVNLALTPNQVKAFILMYLNLGIKDLERIGLDEEDAIYSMTVLYEIHKCIRDEQP